jgi:hypothetical protein
MYRRLVIRTNLYDYYYELYVAVSSRRIMKENYRLDTCYSIGDKCGIVETTLEETNGQKG